MGPDHADSLPVRLLRGPKNSVHTLLSKPIIKVTIVKLESLNRQAWVLEDVTAVITAVKCKEPWFTLIEVIDAEVRGELRRLTQGAVFTLRLKEAPFALL